jgi:hypothetical protein
LSRFEGTGHQIYKNLKKFCDRKVPVRRLCIGITLRD